MTDITRSFTALTEHPLPLAEAFALYRHVIGENVSRDGSPVTSDEGAECPYCGGEHRSVG